MIAESLNIQKTVVLRILKEGLERESCVHVLFHTAWHQSKGNIESHLAKTLSRWSTQTKFFKQKYYGRWYLVFCLWPRNKATEFWMGWWDIPSAEETEIPKVPHQDHIVEHKEFLPEGKRVNAEFYKGVMDRLLKRIQRVHPAAFCSRDFFLLHDNAPVHKPASICQFLTEKKCYNP